ncbi:alpha/beta hydrolase [Streptomyces nodosus]|uniref:Alpha/beta fold hydrolase n=1 Tax=Streptomyces nodosus TaxID=40318 RepID=A0A0B5D764_9ACTN|nr:alpha/beta hydrolase [Streptomyces nodosus]AJE39088.1 alpha/beta hydrolase [Streptomyces nodosus]MBB4789957.1 pimeloyl-ACP methyl ester carboxylesterase [Streptomyces nodosus]QEV37681.1 alpha/beta fold hydrolase [Streptomyces nodosus]
MPSAAPSTVTTWFPSRGLRCAAWLTRPRGAGPHPAVLLVHGFGATHEMRLGRYEQAFAAAGLAVLSFDFAHLGASQGVPRQLISIRRQLADVEAALAFLGRTPGIDPGRIALWGTSLGATHTLLNAARHPELAAVVVQCPVLDTRDAARCAGWRAAARLAAPVVSDLVRRGLRLKRRYVPIVDEPGRTAVVTVPGAKEGWYGMLPPGVDFDNRVTAAVGLDLLTRNAARRAVDIRSPLLVCVSDHETLTDPRIAVRAAMRAPAGTFLRYPADHFAVYHPPLVERIIRDQTDFLVRHLSLSEAYGERHA